MSVWTDSGAGERARDRAVPADTPAACRAGTAWSFSGAEVRTGLHGKRGKERSWILPHAVQTELIQLCWKSSWEGQSKS